MILHGNSRGNAKDMAIRLIKAENELVEVHSLRGFVSQDLMGAFNELYAISRGTKCSQFMYSLSLSPPPNEVVSNLAFEAAIEQAEQRLGLQGQARAIVFYEKNGRRHCHVVWSRIDLRIMTAKQMSHDKLKLRELSRELFRKHGWEVPAGLKDRNDRDPLNYTHDEHQQAQRVGKDAKQIKADMQDAWAASDTKDAFEHVLAEKGYYLACGNKGRYVAVDTLSEVYSIPKQIGIKTKEVRAKLGDGAELLTVDQVKEQIAKMAFEKQNSEPDRATAKPPKPITLQEAL